MERMEESARKHATLTPSQPFRLLDLAAELRVEILSLHAQDAGVAQLTHEEYNDSHGKLTSKDSISLVNKQVRKEYLDVLRRDAHTTSALVIDFDFGHIVPHLTNLSTAEPQTFPKHGEAKSTHTSPKPRFSKIWLEFTGPLEIDAAGLYEWLGCFASADAVAAKVNFSYRCKLNKQHLHVFAPNDSIVYKPKAPLTKAQARVVHAIGRALFAIVYGAEMAMAAPAITLPPQTAHAPTNADLIASSSWDNGNSGKTISQ